MLICFDLGRVLVRICEGWADAHAACGLTSTVPEPDQDARVTIGARVHALEVGALEVDAFLDETAALLRHPRAEVAAMLDAWVRGAYPGAAALLDELRSRGHATACLSNTNARHWQIMTAWGERHDADALLPRFDLRGASHELGARKPDPAIYAAFEAASTAGAGRVPGAAREIVFFDDLADNVAAADARGWRAFQVRSREDPVAEIRARLTDDLLLL